MKNINKIVGIIGLLFCALQPISAQFRMGIDCSYGIPKSFSYYYSSDDEDYMPTAYAGFSFEYVLPRHIMPLYLPLSIKSGIGYAHYEEAPGEEFGNRWGDTFWGQGIGVPLTAELKYLISNNVRAYVNAGITLNCLNVDFVSEENYSYYSGSDDTKWKFMVGGTTEVGIELHNYRIGFGFRKLLSSFNGLEDEEKAGNIFVSVGLRFGGNRLFKKTSKLSVY